MNNLELKALSQAINNLKACGERYVRMKQNYDKNDLIERTLRPEVIKFKQFLEFLSFPLDNSVIPLTEIDSLDDVDRWNVFVESLSKALSWIKLKFPVRAASHIATALIIIEKELSYGKQVDDIEDSPYRPHV